VRSFLGFFNRRRLGARRPIDFFYWRRAGFRKEHKPGRYQSPKLQKEVVLMVVCYAPSPPARMLLAIKMKSDERDDEDDGEIDDQDGDDEGRCSADGKGGGPGADT
jgi:hypothetical protein